jgi:hypothetical protein
MAQEESTGNNEVYFTPLNTLPDYGTPQAQLMYKPTAQALFTLALGAFFLYVHTSFTIVLGAVLIALALWLLLQMKNHPFLQLYPGRLIVFSPEHPGMVLDLSRDEIQSWDVTADSNLFLQLTENRCASIHTARGMKTYEFLNRHMPDQRAENILDKIHAKKKD